MTDRLYLHVGGPKSGTTFLQQMLAENRGQLEASGTWVNPRRLEAIHAAMVVREDPRLERLPAAARGSWDRLVEQVRAWRGPRAVISYELFAGASTEQIERALAPLEGIEVHVVITARDLALSARSAWQERLKFGLQTPLADWRPKGEAAGPRAEWGWRTMDPAGVAARWAAVVSSEQVHVVTVPRAGDRTELWRRFAAACDLQDVEVVAPANRSNESLGLAGVELLRRVNAQIAGPLKEDNRLQARWIRDELAHGVLAHVGGNEVIGVPAELLAAATRRSEATIQVLTDADYPVYGDLEDLRATSPEARPPESVTDGQLLDVAVRALALMLEREQERAESGPPGRGPEGQSESRDDAGVRGTIRKLRDSGRGIAVERLESRVAALELELHDARANQLRVAELTDLVTALFGEPGSPDAEAVKKYREETL